MSLIALIIGIIVNLGCVASSTGVIDISDPKSRELFSGPTKIGNANFYKYTCKDNGSYSNVFDKNFQIFPLRAHTRLVNIVLACRENDVELLQLMYCDVKKDLRLNNLYYRKSEDTWNLIDQATYKSELFNLKNNYVSFQLNEEEHVGFKKVKSEEEDGYDSYVLEEEYEIDKVYENKLVVWESDPNYTFKSLDLAKKKDGTEQLRIQFASYCAEVSEFYKISAGRWVLDIGKRTVDLRSLYTHGSERNEGNGGAKEEEESDTEALEGVLKEYDEENEYEEAVVILASDLCDVEMGFGEVEFNLSFTEGRNQEMIVRYYKTYEISNYEFLTLRGARVNSIKDREWVILDRVEDKQWFYNAKLSFVPDHDVATVALTSILTKEGACDEETKTCRKSPFGFRHFFHKKKETEWSCLEQFPYYYEMNTLAEVGSQLMMKRMYESPPETPKHVLTMYQDYSGKEAFTYDINNPFENRLNQDLLHTEPDFIRLRPKEGTVMNAVIDGSSLLWEQTEVGNGVLMIYIYRSEANLVGHMVVDSKTNPHIFIKQANGRWHIIDKEEYESLKDVPMEPKKTGLFKKKVIEYKEVDEYSLDPDAEIPRESGATESELASEPQASESTDAEGNTANTETKGEDSEESEKSEKSEESEDLYISDSRASTSHYIADAAFVDGSAETAESHGSHHSSHGDSSHHSSHGDSNRNNSNSILYSDIEFDSDDDFRSPRRPVKIKRSSIKQPATTTKSITIELSDDSESEDERGSEPFEGDEL